jgi:hypothetical protein
MKITKPAIASTAVAAMSRRAALAVAVLVAGFALSACGSSSSSNASHASHTTTASAVNPTAACLQLHDWQLHNQGQGISATFGRQLEAETRGTQLGTDIVQWLQDLGVNPAKVISNGPGAIESLASQTVSDAAAVGADCEGYGVRNTLGNSGS